MPSAGFAQARRRNRKTFFRKTGLAASELSFSARCPVSLRFSVSAEKLKVTFAEKPSLSTSSPLFPRNGRADCSVQNSRAHGPLSGIHLFP